MAITEARPRPPADVVVDHLPGPVRTIVGRLRKEDVFLLSAGLAFYALVSVAPFAILALWAISLGADDAGVHQIADQLARLLPSRLDARPALARVADLGAELGFGALLALVWPATACGAGLARGFERLCPGGDRPAKGLRGRAVALALVGVMPALVLVGLIVSYVASSLWGHGLVRTAVGLVVALTASFAVSAVASVGIFELFSPRPVRARGFVRGGAVAGASLSLLSAAYVLFLHLGADFEHRYVTSGLAAIVLLAVWLFLANALILVGYQVAIEALTRRWRLPIEAPSLVPAACGGGVLRLVVTPRRGAARSGAPRGRRPPTCRGRLEGPARQRPASRRSRP